MSISTKKESSQGHILALFTSNSLHVGSKPCVSNFITSIVSSQKASKRHREMVVHYGIITNCRALRDFLRVMGPRRLFYFPQQVA